MPKEEIKIKYCPYCGALRIQRVARRMDNNNPIHVCFVCRRGFSIVLEGTNVVKGGKNAKRKNNINR